MTNSNTTLLPTHLLICLLYLRGGKEILALFVLWMHVTVPTSTMASVCLKIWKWNKHTNSDSCGIELFPPWGEQSSWTRSEPESSLSAVSQGVSFHLDLFFPLNFDASKFGYNVGRKKGRVGNGQRKKRGKGTTVVESLLCPNDCVRCDDTYYSSP